MSQLEKCQKSKNAQIQKTKRWRCWKTRYSVVADSIACLSQEEIYIAHMLMMGRLDAHFNVQGETARVLLEHRKNDQPKRYTTDSVRRKSMSHAGRVGWAERKTCFGQHLAPIHRIFDFTDAFFRAGHGKGAENA